MSAKPPKPGLEETESQYKPEDDAVEFTDAYLDAWFARNADALNSSCDEAQAQIERGEGLTLEEVMARVRTEIKRVAKKA